MQNLEFFISPVNNLPLLRPAAVAQLRQHFPSTIFPADLSNQVLENFGYRLATVIVQPLPDIDEAAQQYCSYTVGTPQAQPNGTWIVEFTQNWDTAKLASAWQAIRARRNALLQASDWVVNNEVVSVETWKRFSAYRQLLRDCINLAQYPHQVCIPPQPEVNLQADEDADLSPDEVQALQNHNDTSPEWQAFLQHWANAQFTGNRRYVKNLLGYCACPSLNETL